jgi:TPP-dependent pyruvate/acetoin dehydrogenase alpha subunit
VVYVTEVKAFMVAKKAPLTSTSGQSNLATRDSCLKFYRDMLLIRRFEERAGQLYGMGLIAGFCHLYIGQEAVVTGMQAAQEGRSSDHWLSRPWPHAGLWYESA